MKIPQMKNWLRKWELYSFPPTLSGSLSNGQSLSQPKSSLRPNSPLYQSFDVLMSVWCQKRGGGSSSRGSKCSPLTPFRFASAWRFSFWFTKHLLHNSTNYQHWCICYDFFAGIYRHIQIRKLLRILLRFINFFFSIRIFFCRQKEKAWKTLLFCLPFAFVLISLESWICRFFQKRGAIFGAPFSPIFDPILTSP